MDKVTNIATALYQNATRQEVKVIAIQLLNGEVSLRDLKKNTTLRPDLKAAESSIKNKQIDKKRVMEFAERFLVIEV
jgi:hypothetical protein